MRKCPIPLLALMGWNVIYSDYYGYYLNSIFGGGLTYEIERQLYVPAGMSTVYCYRYYNRQRAAQHETRLTSKWNEGQHLMDRGDRCGDNKHLTETGDMCGDYKNLTDRG